MSRRSSVTINALGLLFLLLGTFLLAGYYDYQTRQGQQVAADATALLAEVRRLQLVTSLFKTDARHPAANYSSWDEARASFIRHFTEVREKIQAEGLSLERMRRLGETLSQTEKLREDFLPDFGKLRNSPLAAVVSSSGMVAAYEQVLFSPERPGEEVALLGLTLYRLTEYQRAIQQAEGDLGNIERTLGEVAQQRHRNMRISMVIAFVAAMVASALLLRRIIRLHAEVSRDHEARVEAEAKARQSEADLNSMLDSIADAVISTDCEGRITRMNPVACRLTGWSMANAAGLPLGQIFIAVNEATGAVVPNPAERALQEGGPSVWEGNSRLTSRDGVERVVSIGASPIRDASGVQRGAVVIFRDITEQSRMEHRIRNDQRTDSVGKLASGVAHEVNNVLQIVRANLAFAQDPRSSATESAECLSQIDQATRRAADLTRKLLIFSRKHPMRLAEGNLMRFVEGLCPAMRKQLGEKVHLDLNFQEDLPLVRLDQRLLELAFSNLCDNARDSMPQGGKVAVELSQIYFSQQEVEAYPWARPGAFVQITFSDTGRGMDQETLRRIFEPFYTTKSLAVATGLGLSVVLGIVQQHEGFIHAFSEEGRGSTFRIFIPAAHQEELPVPGPAISEMEGHGRRILFADDDAPLRGLVATVLRRSGYEVRVAADGDEACSVAMDPHNHFDMIILDVVMPRLSGIEAARRILGIKPGLPVILCTGHGKGPRTEHFKLEPGWHLVNKPLVPSVLLQVMKGIFDKPAS